MANAVNIIHRITNAVLKIGTHNGTKVVAPVVPSDVKGNEDRDRWMTEWETIAEALVASAAKKAAEGREKKAKARLKDVFSSTMESLKVGDKVTLARDNVSVLLDLRSGQSSLSREQIITTLRVEYKWDMEDITVFLDKVTKVGEPKLYTTFATTVE